MHPSSFDKMAAFCRDYLESRRNEPLTIVDLGSQDINGSYRSIFAHPPWRYVGVDLAPGKNVDVVVRDAYDWRELKSKMADVIVCGQTFEHTEFFWETMLEIARILKPRGLCCIIAPSSGPQHRFPLDCWRIFPDGLSAMARYANLDVVQAHTQWEDLAEYDVESNKWHDSILIARKPAESLRIKLRRSIFSWLTRRLRMPKPAETIIQIFYSADGTHREEDSVYARIGHDDWKDVAIALPLRAAAAPLRIEFVSALTIIEVASLRLTSDGVVRFQAANEKAFATIICCGDGERLPDFSFLRLRITGMDPQLYLPAMESTPGEKLVLEMRLRVLPDQAALSEMSR